MLFHIAFTFLIRFCNFSAVAGSVVSESCFCNASANIFLSNIVLALELNAYSVASSGLAVWGLRMKGALSEYSLMAPAAALLLRVQSLGNTLFLQGFQALALPPEGAMGNRYLQRLRMDSLPLPSAVRTIQCLRKECLMAS